MLFQPGEDTLMDSQLLDELISAESKTLIQLFCLGSVKSTAQSRQQTTLDD